MDTDIYTFLENLADRFKKGKITKEDFLEKIKEAYFEDLGFAKVDHHRNIRRDFPEVIFKKITDTHFMIWVARAKLTHNTDVTNSSFL